MMTLESLYSRKGPAGGCQGLSKILLYVFGFSGRRVGRGEGEGKRLGLGEGRRKKEEGRSKKEEVRRKKE